MLRTNTYLLISGINATDSSSLYVGRATNEPNKYTYEDYNKIFNDHYEFWNESSNRNGASL